MDLLEIKDKGTPRVRFWKSKAIQELFEIYWDFLSTVEPAKSDSDIMFCLQHYQGLKIDKWLVYLPYPHDRINTQVIYRFALAQVVYAS